MFAWITAIAVFLIFGGNDYMVKCRHVLPHIDTASSFILRLRHEVFIGIWQTSWKEKLSLENKTRPSPDNVINIPLILQQVTNQATVLAATLHILLFQASVWAQQH